MSRTLAIYSRKSKFTGKGESIDNQVELCRQYIENQFLNDAPLEILVYEDEGFSGKNTQRPQFKKMFQDAKKKLFSVLVCYRLDRISRNVGDFAGIIEQLNELGIAFVSISEKFDTTTPLGRAMMYIASVFAQLERETIAERIRDNLYELSKTGRWLGGTTPTGYKSEPLEKVSVDGKLKKAYKLTAIPEEAQMIRLIFDKYLETGSLTSTEIFLNQNGYKSRKGIPFSRFSLKLILTNPVYMTADDDAYQYLLEKEADLFSEKSSFDGKHGIMAYNKTLQKPGNTKVRNSKNWVVSVAKHDGLISGASWVKVQRLIEQNSSSSYKKPRSNQALLSGLLLCGECGGYMRPKMTRRIDTDGERVYDYVCSTREKSGGALCKMKRTKGNPLDNGVCSEIIKAANRDSAFVREIENLYFSLQQHSKNEYSLELEQIEKSIMNNEKEISSYVASLARASGTNAEQYIIEHIEICHEKGEQLKKRAKELSTRISDYEISDTGLHKLKKALLSFEDNFNSMKETEKRMYIKKVVNSVVWDGENVHIYFTGRRTLAPLCEDSK